MKILTICQSDCGGGAEKVALELTRELNTFIRDDLIVDIKKTNSYFVKQLGRSNIERTITKIFNKLLNKQGVMCFSKKKFKLLLKEDYDIIHFHNLHGDFFDLDNMKLIADLNIPVVWTIHDIWPITGRCAVDYKCNYWKFGCGNCGRNSRRTYPKMLLDNSKNIYVYKKGLIKSLNLTVVAPSKWMASNVSQSYIKEKEIRVINNGIDLDIYKKLDKKQMRKKYNLSVESKYILIISAKLNDEHKGIRYVIDALNKLKNKGEYTLLVVGNNFDKNLIKDVKVINFGYISDPSKLNEIYSMADIFINPSLADNFPCTNLEAMASGTAVISTNIGGIVEQIDDENGWIIDVTDLEKLELIINKVFDNIQEIWEKGNKGRRMVEVNYSLNMVAKKYLELYKQINERNK